MIITYEEPRTGLHRMVVSAQEALGVLDTLTREVGIGRVRWFCVAAAGVGPPALPVVGASLAVRAEHLHYDGDGCPLDGQVDTGTVTDDDTRILPGAGRSWEPT